MARIKALSVDATSGTVIAINPQGVPQAPAMMYNDIVDDDQILQRIAAVAPEASAVHGASSALARAISLQTSTPDGFIVHQADWISGATIWSIQYH